MSRTNHPIESESGKVVWVDGELHPLPREPLTRTAWWLRSLGRTCVKVACEEGTCGACVVLVDGAAVPSCLLPVIRLASVTRVETARSLKNTPEGQETARNWAAHTAVQCGFCAPGAFASCVAAARRSPRRPAATEEALSSHLCRCGSLTTHTPAPSPTQAAASASLIIPTDRGASRPPRTPAHGLSESETP